MLRRLYEKIKKRMNRHIDEKNINFEEMMELEKQGAILIDVRSPQEYKEGHLDGAILLPEYEIKTKAKEILKDKEKTIIAYCTSGARSKQAQKRLEKMGYNNVYNLENGLENY